MVAMAAARNVEANARDRLWSRFLRQDARGRPTLQLTGKANLAWRDRRFVVKLQDGRAV